MVQSNQFGGMSKDDPNAHIAYFLEVCDLYKINGVSEDAVRLRVFPFSLRDKAKEWLNSLPPGMTKNHCMKLGRGSRRCRGNVHIMVYRFGCKSLHFIMGLFQTIGQ
ncbi:hypothetical protein UlMin_016321 [Ulmus minor]